MVSVFFHNGGTTVIVRTICLRGIVRVLKVFVVVPVTGGEIYVADNIFEGDLVSGFILIPGLGIVVSAVVIIDGSD